MARLFGIALKNIKTSKKSEDSYTGNLYLDSTMIGKFTTTSRNESGTFVFDSPEYEAQFDEVIAEYARTYDVPVPNNRDTFMAELTYLCDLEKSYRHNLKHGFNAVLEIIDKDPDEQIESSRVFNIKNTDTEWVHKFVTKQGGSSFLLYKDIASFDCKKRVS